MTTPPPKRVTSEWPPRPYSPCLSPSNSIITITRSNDGYHKGDLVAVTTFLRVKAGM